MMKRAEARGEVYHPPAADGPHSAADGEIKGTGKNEKKSDGGNGEGEGGDGGAADETLLLIAAAERLKGELSKIEEDESLKAKDRRSAKRKANAVASESIDAKMTGDELLEWYEKEGRKLQVELKKESGSGSNKKDKVTKKKGQQKQQQGRDKPHNPFVVFVGQLSYDTTKEQLLEHFRKELGKEEEFAVGAEAMKARLLTDGKTGRSRGMAFVEVNDPKLLYACLRLHHTLLDGRRINVERTAGGGREKRAGKLRELRDSQERHMKDVVDAMVGECVARGDLRSDELDDGVVALMTRHSATVVQAALERYVESNGGDMDNPSAYLSFLLTKLADEGIYTTGEDGQKQGGNKKGDSSSGQRKKWPQHSKQNSSKRASSSSPLDAKKGQGSSIGRIDTSNKRLKARPENED